MTSPEALAAAKACANFEQEAYGVISKGYAGPTRAAEENYLAFVIDRHFAPLRAERDALALRCAAMEKAIKDYLEWEADDDDSEKRFDHIMEQFRAAALSQPVQVQT